MLAPYRNWILTSLGLHLLLLVLLGRMSLPAPRAQALESLVPIRMVEAAEPAPAPRPEPKTAVAVRRPEPKPEPKPAVVPRPLPKPKPVPPRIQPPTRTISRVPMRPGQPSGRADGVALGPGGGLRRGAGRTSPAPPAIMRTANGKGRPAPPGVPGGTGTQGTGTEPAGPTAGPVRLGGPVPGYPKLAEEAGDEGTVVVRVSISASGGVEDASVSNSSGHASLDAAALRAARSWTFKAALLKGKPVSSTQTIRFHFANGSVTGG